eukprot:1037915_1
MDEKDDSKNERQEILDDIYENDSCSSDPDYVLSLIRDKTINMSDMDSGGRTLLLIATYEGSYEIVNLCLNLGADINHKDKEGHDALHWAQFGAWFHVEQLLLFNKMNANVGNRIDETANHIKKQQGIIQNIVQQLSSYDVTTSQFFKDTTVDLMTNIINQKRSFSDDLLNLCWDFESENNANPLSSKLWQSLFKTCDDIIQNGNKTDWHWLKTFILPSTIWLRNDSGEDGIYLYFKLVKAVEQHANEQLSELKDNLDVLANKNKSDWNAFVSFDIDTPYDVARQDTVPNGIASNFTFEQLSEQNGCSAAFNGHTFYDYNEYLSRLILLAQMVDDDFQKSIQNIFNVDKNTNIGRIQSEEANIEYMRGPVKLLSRARSKAENDYNSEAYPTSACLLDLNRCSLVFGDIATLLSAMETFTNTIKCNQSGSIIGIVRTKNGFHEYVKSPQYADVKFNVLIEGKSNNIIGEVQFLLRTMKEFKDKAHNMYSITRQKEYHQVSVSSILPILLNHDKQLFVAGNMGNAKSLCNLMVISNKTEEDIMKVDEKSSESILANICGLGHLKALKFLRGIISKDLFIERMFLQNRYNNTPIEGAIMGNQYLMVKYILRMDEVKQRYDFEKDKDTFWRLIYWLWCRGKAEVIDLVVDEMRITNEQIIQMLWRKYSKEAEEYHKHNIIHHMIVGNTADIMKKLVAMIGERTLSELILNANEYDVNAMETAVRYNKLDTIKYLLSLKSIKNGYATQRHLQWRLLFWVFIDKDVSEETMHLVLNELSLSTEQVVQLLAYKYVKTSQEFASDCWKYDQFRIVSSASDVNKLRQLVSVIGAKAFTEQIFIADSTNVNGLEHCIKKKNTEMMEYILSFDEIREKCRQNMECRFRMIWWMNEEYDKSICDCVVNALELKESQLKELQSFKYPKPKDDSVEVSYWEKTISDEAISQIVARILKFENK